MSQRTLANSKTASLTEAELSTSIDISTNNAATLKASAGVNSNTDFQPLTFEDLSKDIDAMTLDLHQEEKFFVEQAKKANNVDKTLFERREQLAAVGQAIEQIQFGQQIIDEEVEKLELQQLTLKQDLVALEDKLNIKLEIDMERLHIYPLAENLNAQLKQTSESLKDIVDALNKTAKEADIPTESTSLAQIFKIFDTHTDVLERIESSMELMQRKLNVIDDLQVKLKASFDY